MNILILNIIYITVLGNITCYHYIILLLLVLSILRKHGLTDYHYYSSCCYYYYDYSFGDYYICFLIS